MNKKQIYVLFTGVVVLVITLLIWYIQGAEVFTKTQILVDNTTDLDRMLGVENKQFIDKFVFGLLPSGITSVLEVISVFSIAGLTIFISGFFIYLFRNKRKDTK